MSQGTDLRPSSPSIRTVSSRAILPKILMNLAALAVAKPRRFREDVMRGVWTVMKSFGASTVRRIDVADMGIEAIPVSGSVMSFDRLVLAALSRQLSCRTAFEIGTFRGETTWALVHNNPELRIFTLDLPSSQAREQVKLELTDLYLFQKWDRGLAFHNTPEAQRITGLFGDSATFDFSPYQSSIDLVFIDASHSYRYVKADTKSAFKMLSPDGTIVWHDYPTYPGVYAYLNELGSVIDRPIFHIHGTGLAIYTRQDVPWIADGKGSTRRAP